MKKDRSVKSLLLGTLLAFTGMMAQETEWLLAEAPTKMFWQEGKDYCASLHIRSRMLNLDEVEYLFNQQENMASDEFKNLPFVFDTYWTDTEYDMEGAYSFHFGKGISYPDHKSARHRVMCIKK